MGNFLILIDYSVGVSSSQQSLEKCGETDGKVKREEAPTSVA